jgi:hypothetical protein
MQGTPDIHISDLLGTGRFSGLLLAGDGRVLRSGESEKSQKSQKSEKSGENGEGF